MYLNTKIFFDPTRKHDLNIVSSKRRKFGQDAQGLEGALQAYVLNYWVHRYTLFSKTQLVIAQSSAESEHYAKGSGVSEGLHMMLFLTEAKLSNNVMIAIQTDSSSAKRIAKPYGTFK